MTLIAKKLKDVGYATHQVGKVTNSTPTFQPSPLLPAPHTHSPPFPAPKWHLGNTRTALTPNGRGFDTSLGYLGGAEDHYSQINGGCGCGNAIDIWATNTVGYGLNGI